MAIDNALKNPVVTSVLAVKNGEDFEAVSSKIPLPTSQLLGSALLPTNLTKQCGFVAHGVNVPASLGNLSKFEIFNHVNSGKVIIVYQCLVWHTFGSVVYKVSLSQNALSANESAVVNQNMVAGSNVASIAKIYTKNDDNTSATNVISQAAVTATASNGTNLIPLFQGILLPSSGLRIESTTANMAINGLIVWAEVDLSEIPS